MPEPCNTALRQLSDLIAGILDGGDAASLDRHLTTCESCYRQSVKLFRQDRAFTEMAARARLAEASLRLRRELRPARRWGIVALLGSVAAAGLLVASVVVFLKPAMVLESVAGEVRLDDRPAKSGDAIVAGQNVETRGPGSKAAIRFADSTMVELGEQTLVRDLRETGGKRLLVAHGAVAATVAKQSQPMIIETKSGEVRVLGTSLRVVVDPELLQTRLEVTQGQVQLTRWADKKTVEVSSGHFAVAAPGIELTVRPLSKGKAPADLHELDFRELRGQLTLKSKTWAALPWHVTLHEAREAAAKEKKPIFLIVGSGHPLGYVGANAVVVREGLLNEPDIAKLLSEKFVLLALDNSWLPSISVEEKAWLERFDSGFRYDTIGLGVFTSDGRKLNSSVMFEVKPFRAMLEASLKAFVPATEPPTEVRPSAGDAPPAGGTVVRVTWKAFYDDPESGPATGAGKFEKRFQEGLGTDRLWIRKDEIDALGQGKFPQSLKNRIMKYDLNRILTAKLTKLDLNIEDGRIEGNATGDIDVSFQGFVAVKDGKLTRFELLARGAGLRSAEEGFKVSLSAAPKGRRIPTAMYFELADPAEPLSRIAPHSSRDSAYLR